MQKWQVQQNNGQVVTTRVSHPAVTLPGSVGSDLNSQTDAAVICMKCGLRGQRACTRFHFCGFYPPKCLAGPVTSLRCSRLRIR